MGMDSKTAGRMGALLTNGTKRMIANFMNDTCCGQPMYATYDVVMHTCSEHYCQEMNAYYRACNVCGNDESFTHAEMKQLVRDEIARQNQYEG